MVKLFVYYLLGCGPVKARLRVLVWQELLVNNFLGVGDLIVFTSQCANRCKNLIVDVFIKDHFFKGIERLIRDFHLVLLQTHYFRAQTHSLNMKIVMAMCISVSDCSQESWETIEPFWTKAAEF